MPDCHHVWRDIWCRWRIEVVPIEGHTLLDLKIIAAFVNSHAPHSTKCELRDTICAWHHAIYVENGGLVNAADMLLALVPIGTAVYSEARARDLKAASAKTSYREAAIAASSADALEPMHIEFAATISQPVRCPDQWCCPPNSRIKRRMTACVENQASSSAGYDITFRSKAIRNCCFGCGDADHYLHADAVGGAVYSECPNPQRFVVRSAGELGCQPKFAALRVQMDRSRSDNNWRFNGNG